MTRKTATAVKDAQIDMLGGAPQPEPVAKARQAVAKAAPKPKGAELTVVKNNPANTLALLAQAMTGKDAANLQVIASLHKEMVAEQARIDFIGAFYAMKKELPRINKDGKIEILEKGNDGKRVSGRDKVQQSTPFATYENIREVCDPILDRHGFSMWDETQPSPDGARILVITHLDHNSGHGRVSCFPLPAEVSGSKNNVQGWGSSNSYGKRYGCLNLLNIRTKAPQDMDRDGNAPAQMVDDGKPQIEHDAVALIDEEQLKKVRAAIKFCGVSDASFCKHFEIKKIEDLSAADLDDALAACKNYADKAAK